ncbi:MAG: adenosylcobinamide-GDP ribazoletransferase [Acidimicrobiia bacterium]|nr:adenosylcobinamide-GDP ribazoletransferase [Acidimicrobiia bacterium]
MKRPSANSLHVAAGFLTRVPVGDVSRGGRAQVDIAKAVPWFPVIGLLIGSTAGATYYAASEFFVPLVSACLALGVTLLITGAFHHDGLADIADAFGGGWDVEQRMEILKDSRLGTYGTAALVMALITEVAAVSQLGPREGFAALVVAQTLGRAMALAAMLLAPPAGDGMGASYMARLSPLAVTCGFFVGVATTVVLSPIFPLVTIGAATVATIGVVALSIRKIGGINGDVLGAIHVLASLATLIVTSAG